MNIDDILEQCLFINTSALARKLAIMAKDEFALIGLPPSHAFIVMLLYENPNIQQNVIAAKLHLDTSTITRFLDALELKDIIERNSVSRTTHVSLTENGESFYEPALRAWINLFDKYNSALGEKRTDVLTQFVRLANEKM